MKQHKIQGGVSRSVVGVSPEREVMFLGHVVPPLANEACVRYPQGGWVCLKIDVGLQRKKEQQPRVCTSRMHARVCFVKHWFIKKVRCTVCFG